jgi:hypothetical protein
LRVKLHPNSDPRRSKSLFKKIDVEPFPSHIYCSGYILNHGDEPESTGFGCGCTGKAGGMAKCVMYAGQQSAVMSVM